MRTLHRLRWRTALELWLDEELGPSGAELVLAHLGDCPGCAQEVEEMARLKRSLVRLSYA